ncbi:MAG: outer membrane protein [Hyphomicrobiaceae bacterium]|nr:outer membrane protein [Hyphomicrobiaceae bacterium]
MGSTRTIVAGLAAALLAPGIAQAADLGGAERTRGERDAPYAAPVSWTGLYLGIHGGFGFSSADWDFFATSLGNPGSGAVLGGQIGYNVQWGRVVYGIEGDLSGTWINGADGCGGYTCRHDLDWLGSVRGRLGLAFNGNRTLLYGTGGIAWADATLSSRDGAGVAFGSDFSTTQSGWVAGGGVEHMLSPNLTVRLEYLDYNFKDLTAPAGSLDVDPTHINLSTQVVRFGLNYKF